MKKFLKILVYIFTFIFTIFLFLPKESIYYFVEQNLLKNKIIISNEIVNENLFGLDISNGQIYYENINVASVDKIEIQSFLFYSKIKVNDIKLMDSFENMAPSPIDEIEIKYSVLKFDKIEINSNGLFGELTGFVDIINRVVSLELIASNKMKDSYSKILKNMKLKEGKYYYEYKF